MLECRFGLGSSGVKCQIWPFHVPQSSIFARQSECLFFSRQVGVPLLEFYLPTFQCMPTWYKRYTVYTESYPTSIHTYVLMFYMYEYIYISIFHHRLGWIRSDDLVQTRLYHRDLKRLAEAHHVGHVRGRRSQASPRWSDAWAILFERGMVKKGQSWDFTLFFFCRDFWGLLGCIG